jgi:cytochrome c oxidase subunit IV
MEWERALITAIVIETLAILVAIVFLVLSWRNLREVKRNLKILQNRT